MKKFICTFICLCLLAGILPGCGKTDIPQDSGKLHIVTTIFPQYDWTRAILGEHAENAQLTMLLDNGVDLHSYQPTADDMIALSGCDLFIYVGGESDGWVTDALKNVTNKEMVVINLLDVLGEAVKTEDVIEGMQPEQSDHEEDHEEEHEEGHEADHEADHEEAGHDHDAGEADEHVWLSLKNAEVLCSEIADKLSVIDPDNKAVYTANLEAYITQLNALDKEYKTAVDSAVNKTLLFGDRFPFRYLVDDYGLNYYAAFAGCSAETEASFETISFLAAKVDELKLPCVLTIEGTKSKIAETIVASTTAKNQQILALDSLQAVTAKDVENGVGYLSVMEKNLEVLKLALQ